MRPWTIFLFELELNEQLKEYQNVMPSLKQSMAWIVDLAIYLDV